MEVIPVEAILERDIDLLLLEELHSNFNFLEWVVNQLGLPAVDKLQGAWRSISAFGLGETDILVSYLSKDSTIYLLIENKIDAEFQEGQPQRYQQRSVKYIAAGHCQHSFPLLVAPEKYINEQNYFKHAISYEKVRDWFRGQPEPRFLFKASLLEIAIEKLRRGYKAVNHAVVQNFMASYWKATLQQLPGLVMNKPDVVPAGSDWIQLSNKSLKRINVTIIHKLAKGYIDAQLGSSNEDTITKIKNILPPAFELEKTGKSWSIRKKTYVLDRMQDFHQQYDKALQAFAEIRRMVNWIDENEPSLTY